MDANVEKDAKVHCATVAMVTTLTHCLRTESGDVTYLVHASPLFSIYVDSLKCFGVFLSICHNVMLIE